MGRHIKPRGVSLLEMLVALVILAISATLVFEWISQSSLRLLRLQDQQRTAAAQLKALAFLETLNPARAPVGTQAFDGFDLTWQAQVLQPMRPLLLASDAPSRFEGALYGVKARVIWAGTNAGAGPELQTRLIGWLEKPSAAFVPGRGADQDVLLGSGATRDAFNPRPTGVGMVLP